MLSVEDWAEIRRLRRAEQVPIAQIARMLGISRNTVKAPLASDGPPKYQRMPKGSVADAYEPRIRELLAAYPQMPATVIAGRIGWPYSIRTLSGKVAGLRISSRTAEDLFAGWWRLIARLGAVPRVLVWDGKARWADTAAAPAC